MKKNTNDIYIFVDFDGTIMLEDTSDEVFRFAGGFKENLALLKNKDINIFEYWRRFSESISKKFNAENLQDFTNKFEMDKYFPFFVDLCRMNSLPISIVSDNFDIIVSQILTRNSITNLDIFVNELEYSDGKFIPKFIYASEGCEESFAAVCKRNIILKIIPDNAIVVYIGDGYSDYGAAVIADVIFAKKSLAKYCSENRIPHHTFKTFFDVKFILEKMIMEDKIRPRYQAHLARKRTYENE